MREITISGGAVAVKTLPNRPSENHEWNGVAWILYDPAVGQAEVVAAINDRFDDLNGTDRVLLKISFLQENRLRLLEGKAVITARQFRAWVDAQT